MHNFFFAFSVKHLGPIIRGFQTEMVRRYFGAIRLDFCRHNRRCSFHHFILLLRTLVVPRLQVKHSILRIQAVSFFFVHFNFVSVSLTHSGVNLTDILHQPFAPIFLCQKITKPKRN